MCRDNENGKSDRAPSVCFRQEIVMDALFSQLEFSETGGQREGGQEREGKSAAC